MQKIFSSLWSESKLGLCVCVCLGGGGGGYEVHYVVKLLIPNYYYYKSFFRE